MLDRPWTCAGGIRVGAAEIKSIAAGPLSDGRLLRVLGFSFALAVGVGGVIGGGILRTPASVVDAVGNVGIALLVWAAVAVHCLIQANSVAEVSAALPKAGGLFVPA